MRPAALLILLSVASTGAWALDGGEEPGEPAVKARQVGASDGGGGVLGGSIDDPAVKAAQVGASAGGGTLDGGPGEGRAGQLPADAAVDAGGRAGGPGDAGGRAGGPGDAGGRAGGPGDAGGRAGGPGDAGGPAISAAAVAADSLALLEALGSPAAALQVPSRLSAPPFSRARPLPPKQDLLAQAQLGPQGRLQIRFEGKEQTLTIRPRLQDRLTSILRTYQTPYAAAVAIEPSTGRVLAMAEHSEADPAMRGLCTKAIYPAASVFKIVTAAALLGEGVKPDASECYHGGKRRLSAALLADSSRDQRCLGLGEALAQSANVVFAKLTLKHLSPEKLIAKAQAFRFNSPWPFPVPTEMSLAAIPEDPLGFSSAGAGFGDVYLSPLHGAALAAVSANGGLWRAPILFEGAAAAPAIRVMSPADSDTLNEMLEGTVLSGTARRVFRERGFRVPGAVGKTGSLADKRPFRDYSWFVGFAPKDNPKVAVAAVIVNDAYWRIRATWLGREALRLALEEPP